MGGRVQVFEETKGRRRDTLPTAFFALIFRRSLLLLKRAHTDQWMLNVILNRKLSGAQLRRRPQEQKKKKKGRRSREKKVLLLLLCVCLSPSFLSPGFHSAGGECPQSLIEKNSEQEKPLEPLVWFTNTGQSTEDKELERIIIIQPRKKKERQALRWGYRIA